MGQGQVSSSTLRCSLMARQLVLVQPIEVRFLTPHFVLGPKVGNLKRLDRWARFMLNQRYFFFWFLSDQL